MVGWNIFNIIVVIRTLIISGRPEDLEEKREKMSYFIKESKLQPRRRLFRRSKLELVTSHFS